MWDALKALLKQPLWIITVVLGTIMVALPCVTIDKDYRWSTHSPSTLWPPAVGIALLLISALSFAYANWADHLSARNAEAGLDLSRVEESKGEMWTTVSGCEIRVVEGRVQDYASAPGTTIVLPCNEYFEYFDDRCVEDTRSALGAYINQVFEGQTAAFISLVKGECGRKLGPPVPQQKTNDESAESFGPGRCVLLLEPLGRSSAVALVSTTTQRAGQGLAARISYLFDGMRELVARLADARLNEVVMPILGAGHGQIDTALAFVGLLLAIAEVARYGQGGQRLRKVTVVVFKRDADTPSQVDRAIIRRALALIGARG
jgi:hypothetical protein